MAIMNTAPKPTTLTKGMTQPATTTVAKTGSSRPSNTPAAAKPGLKKKLRGNIGNMLREKL